MFLLKRSFSSVFPSLEVYTWFWGWAWRLQAGTWAALPLALPTVTEAPSVPICRVDGTWEQGWPQVERAWCLLPCMVVYSPEFCGHLPPLWLSDPPPLGAQMVGVDVEGPGPSGQAGSVTGLGAAGLGRLPGERSEQQDLWAPLLWVLCCQTGKCPRGVRGGPEGSGVGSSGAQLTGARCLVSPVVWSRG